MTCSALCQIKHFFDFLLSPSPVHALVKFLSSLVKNLTTLSYASFGRRFHRFCIESCSNVNERMDSRSKRVSEGRLLHRIILFPRDIALDAYLSRYLPFLPTKDYALQPRKTKKHKFERSTDNREKL